MIAPPFFSDDFLQLNNVFEKKWILKKFPIFGDFLIKNHHVSTHC
jgi:hypothetical protein